MPRQRTQRPRPTNTPGGRSFPSTPTGASSAATSRAPTRAELDDSAWQPVRLPHDWAIAGPFDPDGDGGSGKLPWKGVGWYRKTFTLDEADAGREVYLDFDGVMAFPKVYINGQLAGEWDYGYTSFRVDATPYVKFGEPNTVAVRVDTRNWGTRWYPGAGIYRKVDAGGDQPGTHRPLGHVRHHARNGRRRGHVCGSARPWTTIATRTPR